MIFSIDENRLKESKNLLELDCAVLDMLEEQLEGYEGMSNREINEYLNDIEMEDIDEAIKNELWVYRLLDGKLLIVRYEMINHPDNIPWILTYGEKLDLKIKYKWYKIIEKY